ncbi:MAG: Stp1/IreP family PP2C-type Ser/Thr phosphatase [Clostridiales bacterium]|nr:Stp1/IreP family PP2C-type Ser/Thr phosphatase [Clostridiales bacterium]
MEYFGLSNKGKVRGNNEDFFHIPQNDDDIKMFIVADGMGGENAGEVASCLAVSSIALHIKENYNSIDDIPLLLRQALNSANKTVYETAKTDINYKKMGTTVVCAIIKDGLCYVANVGDSRCYIVNENNLQQISIDHSFVQEMVDKGLLSYDEAKNHPNKNLITRAIGVERFVLIDVFSKPFKKGDKLLLASDGLTGMVDYENISSIINNSETCEDAVKNLIDSANEAGGKDNITAVLICNN